MLAAKLDQTQPLSLFVLVLSLVRGGQDVPMGLREHFISIVRQAQRLAREPSSANARVDREAVDLAVQMRAKPELSKAIGEINEFDQVDPQRASAVLNEVERVPVT